MFKLPNKALQTDKLGRYVAVSMRRIFCWAMLSLVLSGCAETNSLRIDSSSDEAFQKSFAALESSLNPEERMRLSVAILRIRATGIKMAEEMHHTVDGKPIYPIDVKDQISGMTLEQILELAEKSGVTAEILHEAT